MIAKCLIYCFLILHLYVVYKNNIIKKATAEGAGPSQTPLQDQAQARDQ